LYYFILNLIHRSQKHSAKNYTTLAKKSQHFPVPLISFYISVRGTVSVLPIPQNIFPPGNKKLDVFAKDFCMYFLVGRQSAKWGISDPQGTTFLLL